MKNNRINLSILVPVISLAVILVVFGILTKGNMFTWFNLSSLIQQTIILLIFCSGAVFVIALGCCDLSVGVNAGICALMADIVWRTTGNPILMILVPVAIGIGMGALSGTLNAKFKVPSFMCTLALLIGVRGLINFIQNKVGIAAIPQPLSILQNQYIKIIFVVIILVIVWFVLERTAFGRNVKAVGENEVVAKNVGKPVIRIKTICFMISGLTASIAGFFIIARSGGTTTTMGQMYEMRTLIAIYVGGILVRGGSTASIYKVIIGCFVVTIIENGLKILGFGSSEVAELVEGLLFMIILFITIRAENFQPRIKSEVSKENTME